jgi:hypothetical protein
MTIRLSIAFAIEPGPVLMPWEGTEPASPPMPRKEARDATDRPAWRQLAWHWAEEHDPNVPGPR